MGGGLAWMAVTDPVWKSPGGKTMRLVAAAPRYGWTDLLYSLVPTGRHLRGTPGDPAVPTDGSASEGPFGFVKQSIMAAFYAQSKIVLPIPTVASRATFPPWLDEAYICLNLLDPTEIETHPLCATFRDQMAPGFISDRSAYYRTIFSRVWAPPRTRSSLCQYSARALSRTRSSPPSSIVGWSIDSRARCLVTRCRNTTVTTRTLCRTNPKSGRIYVELNIAFAFTQITVMA